MKNIFLKNNNTIIENIKKGFTLAEMIVVVAIIAVISTLSLYNSSKLNSSVLLSNTAYEISLIIRDAQISGLGVRVTAGGEGVATTSNQGVYFDISTPEKIVFFSDKNKSNRYEIGEENQVYNIENKRAGKIIKICKINQSQTTDTCTEVTNMSVLFKRPNPESYFYNINQSDVTEEYQGSIAINIGFNTSECKSVVIYKTGAIQIDKSFCN